MSSSKTPSLDEVTIAYIRAGNVYINARITGGLFANLKGLLSGPPLNDREALVLSPCNSAHTCGMQYAIDLIFLNKQFQVLKIVHALQPWRFTYCKEATHTMKMRGGQAINLDLQIGQTFIFYPTTTD
ncbi:DUF192 domain-containing protein [Methylotenera sp. N17]|uniref:DUF192 domain-containing protein n=1 Tax=Methylotenera sp. N17 TaxID=1502761 RepID=UPI0006901437|nr:DUF192 domain-containing protein [Methylotenera sp. N17]